jgi:hypothetical protein
MDLLFSYNQQKKDKNKKTDNQIAGCLLRLYVDGNDLCYEGYFDFDYDRYGSRRHVTFEHNLVMNMVNGDIVTSYKIVNDGLTKEKFFKNTTTQKKNDFKLLFDLVENGITRGEKRRGFWGVKYERAVENMSDLIIKHVQPKFKSKFYVDKNFKTNISFNSIYDLFVDYHLDMKGIKAHDGIYFDIQNQYPKKKWLEKNDHKYLPSILDSFGIKSKYLIGELNKSDKYVQISSLNYLCKLFGKNHIEYLKQFLWQIHCYDVPPNKKTHELKNEVEKDYMVKVISKWETETVKTDSLIYSVNKLFTTRELLEQRGLDLKFKAKNDVEYDNLTEMWNGFKLHFARGYKLRYVLPIDFVSEIEEDIVIDGLTFKPKILLTEEEFRIEGYTMKNCMSKQFSHGCLYTFVSLINKRKKINLQYRKGNLVQSYGKANTIVIPLFENAVEILTQRFKKYPTIEWKKEKFNFITN